MIDIEERDRMPDKLDFGTYIAANLNLDAVARVRRQGQTLADMLGPLTGLCLYCGGETPGRFCDMVCSVDWQNERDARRRSFGET
jgi:hypothetical protein